MNKLKKDSVPFNRSGKLSGERFSRYCLHEAYYIFDEAYYVFHEAYYIFEGNKLDNFHIHRFSAIRNFFP